VGWGIKFMQLSCIQKKTSNLLLLGALSLTAWATSPTTIYAGCLSTLKGQLVVDILQCQEVKIPADLALDDEAFVVTKSMSAGNRKKLFRQYVGKKIKAYVQRSDAFDEGLGVKNALKGQKIDVFFRSTSQSCKDLNQKRAKVLLNQTCCDGRSDAPCMIKGSKGYYFETIQTIGGVGGSVGNKQLQQAIKHSDYLKAARMLKQGEYAESAKLLDRLLKEGKLDVRGHYLLGIAHHRDEQCAKAIVPLEKIREIELSGKLMAGEMHKILKPASFLLARCYARQLKAGKAVIILNSYLISPDEYLSQIRKSLKAPEFGAIHTSKEYIKYRRRAKRALRNR
jgi:hypothetical protein